MSDYIYHIGNDYDCINKEYVILSTDKGQQITVALTASRVPFKGRYDEESIIFDYDGDYKESVDEIIENLTSDKCADIRRYDGDYKESVDEIIENLTSDKCADIRREIEEHRRNKDYLFFIPVVAKLLRMTEGTLRRRPVDIQLAVCKRYADNWGCDTYTMQYELRDAMMLTTKPES